MRSAISTACVFALTLAIGCGSDETGENNAEECPAGESYDPIEGDCVRLAETNNRVIGPGGDAGMPDTDRPDEDVGTDAGAPDARRDVAPPGDMGCMTDDDGDGAIAMACGGDDCDDNDDRRAPQAAELCDEVDNDCDGDINEELDCSVYAHSNTRLYRIDFFAGTYDDLGETVANLYDIDTHPDGTIYGIADNYLHTYDPGSGQWTRAAQSLGFLENTNGFCIDSDGTAFVTTLGLSNTLRTVNLATGASTSVGSMSPASSSGDCVVTKGNVLFMTSNHTTPDSFAQINGDNGSPTIVGQTNHDGIWGLTAAYNRVFGMTSNGDVVEINPDTGETTVIHNYPDISFYGAASTPDR